MRRPIPSPSAVRLRSARRLLAAAALLGAAAAPALWAQDSLRLADLQAAAVARDPRTAQAAVLRAQSALRLQNLRSERLPTFSVAAQAQHQSDVTSVNFPGAVQPWKDTYDANVGARLRLYDPSRAARTAVEQAQETEAMARLDVTLFAQRQAVNDAFFQALLLDAQRGVLADAITDLESQLRLARERATAGAALPSDAAMLEAELLRRRQSLDEAATGRTVALAILADLVGRPVAEDAPLAMPALDAATRAARSGLEGTRARPEFRQFEASGAVVGARQRALAAQSDPRVSVFGRTGYGRPGLNMLSREFDTYWVAGVQVEWSPFDWGTVRREREAIALQTQVLTSEAQAFHERLQRATRGDLAAIDRLERTLASDDAIVALRERILAESRLRYTEGVLTAAEFVDRETDLNTARLQRETHRVELAQARARFLTTVGLEVR